MSSAAQAGEMSPLEEARRRTVLGYAAAFLGGLTALGVGYPLGSYLWPRAPKGGEGGSRSLKMPAEEVPLGEAKFIRFLGKPAVVIRPNEQEIVALSAVCTHLGCVVKWSEGEGVFKCPCHGGVFDTKGTVLGGPPPTPLPTFAARIEDGYVVIEEA